MFTFGDALSRAHRLGPTTRLSSTSLRLPRRPPWDRLQTEVSLRVRLRAPIQRARRHCRDRRTARDRKSCTPAPHSLGLNLYWTKPSPENRGPSSRGSAPVLRVAPPRR